MHVCADSLDGMQLISLFSLFIPNMVDLVKTILGNDYCTVPVLVS